MVLDVAHRIEEPLREGLIVRQRLDRGAALLAAMIEIREQLLFCIRAIGVEARWIEFAEGEGRGRSEVVRRFGHVEVKVEKSVIGRVPEAGPGPEGIGAGADGIFEHVDRSAELRPENRFEEAVHGVC